MNQRAGGGGIGAVWMFWRTGALRAVETTTYLVPLTSRRADAGADVSGQPTPSSHAPVGPDHG